ncbi:MAG: hypothetical protein AAGC55_24465 [Myxococcota bacterium]
MAVWAALSSVGCEARSPSATPKGTLADPVEVCERVGDACRIDEARLGVCMHDRSGNKMECTPQH